MRKFFPKGNYIYIYIFALKANEKYKNKEEKGMFNKRLAVI